MSRRRDPLTRRPAAAVATRSATATAAPSYQPTASGLAGRLHANFSFAVADQLLALITKKGW